MNKTETNVTKRIGDFLKIIDDMYPPNWVNLTYEKNIQFCEIEENYEIFLEFWKEKNSKRKIVYLSKLPYVKCVNWREKSYTFKLCIPKKGTFNINMPEHDSTNDVWEFYRCRYGTYLKDESITFEGKTFKVHGEVDFNFSLDKIDDFQYIVNNDESDDKEKKNLQKNFLICVHVLIIHY